MTTKSGFLSALMAAALAGGVSTPAGAIMIHTVSVGNLSTANASSSATLASNQFFSTVAVTDGTASSADFLGATVDVAARYASTTWADAGAFSNTNRNNQTNSYTFTFTVDAPLGNVYQIDIDTRRTGALTLVDDGSENTASSQFAEITAVTGQVNAVTQGALALPAVAKLQGTSGGNTPFNQTSTTYTLSGLQGSNTYTLQFTWATSAQSAGSGLDSLTGADEAAVRLGVENADSGVPIGGASADDYPGVGGRVKDGDGHFAVVTATITTAVPEPSTLALLGMGLVGLAVARFHRK